MKSLRMSVIQLHFLFGYYIFHFCQICNSMIRYLYTESNDQKLCRQFQILHDQYHQPQIYRWLPHRHRPALWYSSLKLLFANCTSAVASITDVVDAALFRHRHPRLVHHVSPLLITSIHFHFHQNIVISRTKQCQC